MHPTIRAPREFWLGILYLALGSGAMFVASAYPMGTAGRMGPGYMPRIICGLLLLFGVVSLLRSVRLSGEPIGALSLKPLLLVLSSVIAFAALVVPFGLVAGIITLVLLSAAASPEFRFGWLPALGLLGLTAFCCAVFVWGLGIPLTLFGTWFGR